MAITLCVLLWPHEDRTEELIEYEDRVLPLLSDHGARVVVRTRTDGEHPEMPLEVHILEFPSESALESYMGDERRQAMSDARDRAIRRTEVAEVTVVETTDLP